jgi:lysophospholipid acyltransferase (LPLAT)-like uncharacterized protein
MARSEFANRILSHLVVPLAAHTLNLWFRTCRVTVIGQDLFRRFAFSDTRVIAATWHRGAIFLVWFFREIHPMIMFSRSRDGELLAGFARRLGVIPVRGSSGRGGREALEAMRRYIEQPGSRKAATVLDGPRGPAYVAKKGMLVLAGQTRAPLVPIMVSAHPALTFTRAWDRTMVPLPFSRVLVMFGEPWSVTVDPGDTQAMEALRRAFEETLNRMRDMADRDTGYTGG